MTPSLFYLFWLFFYIGLITIGGGLVAIPIMQQMIVEPGLISPAQFCTMIAISESTPGPIGVNMATYIGYEFHGVWGGVIVTLGTVLPSFLCTVVIARWFARFFKTPLVRNIFYGLRPAVTGMIAVAAWQVLTIAILTLPHYRETRLPQDLCNPLAAVFYIAALAVLFKTKLHPACVILAGAIFGILFL